MNRYFVYAENLHYSESIDIESPSLHFDDGWIAEYVEAETPGKAKALVFKQQRHQFSHLEYTDLRVTTLPKMDDVEYRAWYRSEVMGYSREEWL